MNEGAWFDDEQQTRTKERNRDDDVIDLEPTGLQVREVDETASLAALARELGPRDRDDVYEQARRVGTALGSVLDDKGEGTRAYYRWPVGKGDKASIVEGPTVDLMDALAGVWGRLLYSIKIVEERGSRVHLRGRVLDLVAIVAHERDYIGHLRAAPAKFADRPDEAERWRVMQLQAAESKAIRGVLEHVIPAWVTTAALEAARDAASAKRLGGNTLPEAVRKSIGAFTALKVDGALLERWIGRPSAEWTAFDVGELRGLHGRVKRGELTPDGVRGEAVQREAGRASEEQPEATPTATGDRLAGLGLGKPAAPTPPPPQPTTPTPTPTPTEKPGPTASTPKPDPKREAELIRDRIKLIGRWPVKADEARKQLREALGLARMGDERFLAAVQAGRFNGWWSTDDAGDLYPFNDEQPPAQPTATSVPGPDPWDDPGQPTGLELEAAIGDCELSLKTEQCKAACIAAGIPWDEDAATGEDGPNFDGIEEPQMRRYLEQLRARVTL